MRKIGTLLVLIALFVGALPSIVLAGGEVPAGLTLQSWIVGGNQSHASISFYYSGGFSTDIALKILYDPSWHKLNDVRPILEAYKEGYGQNLGGTGGILGTTINFAPNVLAAMKAQNFNPKQVGGADIPPSTTTLTADQLDWLQKGGYSVQVTSQTTTSSSTPTPKSTPTQTQTPEKATQQTTPAKSSTESTPVQNDTKVTVTPTQTDPEVGQTVKTPAGTMTPQIAVEDQKLAVENPPDQNPENIPSDIPANAKKNTSLANNFWVWVGAGAIILILIAVAGRIKYARRHV